MVMLCIFRWQMGVFVRVSIEVLQPNLRRVNIGDRINHIGIRNGWHRNIQISLAEILQESGV